MWQKIKVGYFFENWIQKKLSCTYLIIWIGHVLVSMIVTLSVIDTIITTTDHFNELSDL